MASISYFLKWDLSFPLLVQHSIDYHKGLFQASGRKMFSLFFGSRSIDNSIILESFNMVFFKENKAYWLKLK